MQKVNLSNISDLAKQVPLPEKQSLIRAAIGACAGIVLVLLIMLIMSLFSLDKADEQLAPMDQEEVAIPSTVIADDPVNPQQQAVGISTFTRFDANKKPLTPEQAKAIDDDTARLSLVIQMAGQNRKMNGLITEKIPNTVTLSVSPYLSDHNETAGIFSQQGYEIWLMMATETLEKQTDNGQFALSPVRNLNSNMNALINQLQGKDYVTGITFDEKSLMPSADIMWPQIIRDLFAEGYAIHDTTQIAVSSDVYSFDQVIAPYIKGNIQLDLNVSDDIAREKLEDLKAQIIMRKNLIVSTTIPYPAALDILAEWVNSLETEGITLIPLSAQTLNE